MTTRSSADGHDARDSDSLLSHSKEVERIEYHPRARRTALWIVLSLLASHIIALAGGWILSRLLMNRDSICARYTAQYSQIHADLRIQYSTVKYNGSFFHQTVYRRDPSDEVDAAWQALGVDYRPLRVNEAEAAKSGLGPSHVKIQSKYGGGYPANVEGLHHLHCLNLLRQTLKFNYDYYKARGEGAFQNEDYVVKVHATHCLDILRQQLMCTVDTGVLGQVWWNKEKPTAFVDFNTEHRCKNFDSIRQWAEKRQLPLPENLPPDFLQHPTSEEVYTEIP